MHVEFMGFWGALISLLILTGIIVYFAYLLS